MSLARSALLCATPLRTLRSQGQQDTLLSLLLPPHRPSPPLTVAAHRQKTLTEPQMDTSLITLINKLQDAFTNVGIQNPIDLPQITVLGSQSS